MDEKDKPFSISETEGAPAKREEVPETATDDLELESFAGEAEVVSASKQSSGASKGSKALLMALVIVVAVGGFAAFHFGLIDLGSSPVKPAAPQNVAAVEPEPEPAVADVAEMLQDMSMPPAPDPIINSAGPMPVEASEKPEVQMVNDAMEDSVLDGSVDVVVEKAAELETVKEMSEESVAETSDLPVVEGGLDDLFGPDAQAPEAIGQPGQKGFELDAPSNNTAGNKVTRAPEANKEKLYFDSNVPTQSFERGPQRVDPRTSPAQKYIVVEKDSGPNDVEAMLESGKRALKLGRYKSAMSIFEELHKRNSRDPRILMGLAVSQQKNGFTQAAIQTYEKLLDEDSSNTDAMVNMLGLIKEDNPSVALDRLLELWRKHPKHAGIAAQIGLLSAELNNYEDAHRYLGIAASMEPDRAGHVYNLAIITDRQGHRKQAIQLYEDALQIDAVYGAGRSIPRESIYDRLAQLRRQ